MAVAGGNRSHAFITSERKPFYLESYRSGTIEILYFFSFNYNVVLVMGKLDPSAPHGLPSLAAYFYTITDIYHLTYNHNKIGSSGDVGQKCMH